MGVQIKQNTQYNSNAAYPTRAVYFSVFQLGHSWGSSEYSILTNMFFYAEIYNNIHFKQKIMGERANVSKNFSSNRYSDLELSSQAGIIVLNMTGNEHYPTPSPTLEEITTANI